MKGSEKHLLITPGLLLLKKSFEDFKKLWKKFVLLQLITYITPLALAALALLSAVIIGPWLSRSGEESSLLQTIMALILGLTVAVMFIITLVVNVFSIIAQIRLAREKDLKPGVWMRFWGARKDFWGFVLVSVLSSVIVLVGSIFLIIPGIIAAVFLSFAVLLLLFENKRGWGAIKGSYELARGFWFTIFGRLFLLLIIFFLLSIPSFIPLFGTVWNIIIALILIPIGLLYSISLWDELSAIKNKAPKSSDGMRAFKKVGLAVVLALPFIIIPIVIGILAAIIKNAEIEKFNIKIETPQEDEPGGDRGNLFEDAEAS